MVPYQGGVVNLSTGSFDDINDKYIRRRYARYVKAHGTAEGFTYWKKGVKYVIKGVGNREYALDTETLHTVTTTFSVTDSKNTKDIKKEEEMRIDPMYVFLNIISMMFAVLTIGGLVFTGSDTSLGLIILSYVMAVVTGIMGELWNNKEDTCCGFSKRINNYIESLLFIPIGLLVVCFKGLSNNFIIDIALTTTIFFAMWYISFKLAKHISPFVAKWLSKYRKYPEVSND